MEFTQTINAPKEKVWHTMLDHPTYEQWTVAFSEGSTFDGSWDEGSDITFGDGSGSGIYSRVAESTPYERVSVEHLGELKDGKPSSEDVPWKGARETYTFSETDDGQTIVHVELTGMNMPAEMEEMFAEMWPKALDLLKELAEAT